jgi:hypothetical protein
VSFDLCAGDDVVFVVVDGVAVVVAVGDVVGVAAVGEVVVAVVVDFDYPSVSYLELNSNSDSNTF